METTINLTLQINVGVLNRVLALVQEDLITTDEQLQDWDELLLSTNDITDSDQLLAIGSIALIAKGTADEKRNNLK